MFSSKQFEDIPVVLSIQFAPDYTNNTKIPELQYKPDHSSPKSGFGDHMNNMGRKFMECKWSEMHGVKAEQFGKKLSKDQKYNIYKDTKLKHINHHNLTRKQKIAQLRKFTIEKKRLTTMAHALFYSNMKPHEALTLLQDADIWLDVSEFPNDEETNVIIESLVYIYLRLLDCTHNCLICDEEILIPYVKDVPTICTHFKCQFEYIDLGMCSTIPMTICPSSVVSDLMEDENVVDLLLNMTWCAANSGRKHLVFRTFFFSFVRICDITRVFSSYSL